MFFLHDLPRALLLTLLSQWIDIPCLVSLDTAYCHHSYRKEWLALLRDPQLQLTDTALQTMCQTQQGRKLLHFIVWTIHREVALSSLFIDSAQWQTMARLPFFRLPTVRSLHFIEKDLAFETELFRTFLSFFPDLKEVDCTLWAEMPEEALNVLGELFHPIHSLKLFPCRLLSASSVTMLTHYFKGSLKFFSFEGVDESLAKSLIGLKGLAIGCDLLSSEALLSCCNRQNLQSLTLVGSKEEIYGLGFVSELVRQCGQNLRTLDLSSFAAASVSALPAILQTCTRLEMVSIGSMTCQLSRAEREVAISLCSPQPSAEDVLRCFREDSWQIRCLKVSCKELTSATERCLDLLNGQARLEALVLSLPCQLPSVENWQSLWATSGQRLQTLHLHNCEALLDSYIVPWHHSFPALRSVGLYGASGVTSRAFQTLLIAWKTRKLQRLMVQGCVQFDEKCLREAILSFSSSLLCLDLTGTSVSKERLLALFPHSQLLAKCVILPFDQNCHKWNPEDVDMVTEKSCTPHRGL